MQSPIRVIIILYQNPTIDHTTCLSSSEVTSLSLAAVLRRSFAIRRIPTLITVLAAEIGCNLTATHHGTMITVIGRTLTGRVILESEVELRLLKVLETRVEVLLTGVGSAWRWESQRGRCSRAWAKLEAWIITSVEVLRRGSISQKWSRSDGLFCSNRLLGRAGSAATAFAFLLVLHVWELVSRIVGTARLG